MKAWAAENLDRNYTHRNSNICILLDNQVAIKDLGNRWITSKVVWDCHQSLMQLTKHSSADMGGGS
jgi:hypothetical protein